MVRWDKYLQRRDIPLAKFLAAVGLVLALIAIFYGQLVAWIGSNWVWLLIGVIVMIGGRLSLYRWRKSRGRKDYLDTARWWDSL